MEITINDLKVYTNGNKTNPSIVFVHGFPYDHTMWEKQVEALQNSYYCVTYDIRGLGNSYVGDGQYTMEAFVWDLYSVMDELQLDKPILCGLSMGGYIALRAIEKEQNRFGSLILCDTRTEADNNEGKLKRSNAINRINVDGVEAFVNDFVPVCFHPNTKKKNSKMYKSILANCKTQNATGVKGSLIAMLSRGDTTKSLKNIKIPTLVLCGRKDTLTPVEIMEAMAKKIKKSKFVVVPNAGHMTPLENPNFVTKSIQSFLSKNTINKN
ncbi:MAG: alpha/beta hydrolase [Melioribacteraceae bacterium]